MPQKEGQRTHPADLGVTIGKLGELAGYDSVRVRGRSIVFGLPGTGSSECPPVLRDYLTKHILVYREKGFLPAQYDGMSAEQIINSTTTAAVEVAGIVPAGAPKGTRFDVNVSIPWATQTTSLQGGILFPAEMQVVVAGMGGRELARRPTAMAAGPIFINPLPLTSDGRVRSDPRKGTCIGGGYSLKDRKIQFVLFQPDSAIAQQLQRRINSRFQSGTGGKTADATRSYVNLSIPGNYRDNYQHFIDVLLNMYVQSSSSFEEMKLRELSEMARQDDADFEAIALAWEAIGRNSLNYLEPLYTQRENPALQYYAARTALHLEDKKTIDVLIEIAQNDGHPYRLHAVKSLAHAANDIHANIALAELLSHDNTRIKLLAYDALRRTPTRKIDSTMLPFDVRLDVVDAVGKGTICVWASKEPRIIVFGKHLMTRQNFFFETDDGTVTLNAQPGDEKITIIRQSSHAAKYISEKSIRSVEEMILKLGLPSRKEPPKSALDMQRPYGMELTFSQMVGVLYHLCEEEVIPAHFMMIRRVEDLLDAGKPARIDAEEIRMTADSLTTQ